MKGDQLLTVALMDEGGKLISQWESEPAGKRPTSGWTTDEYIEDGWKVRLPRELPRGKVRLVVSMVDPVTSQRVQTAGGSLWAELPLEVTAE